MYYGLWGKLLGTFSSSCPQEKKKSQKDVAKVD